MNRPSGIQSAADSHLWDSIWDAHAERMEWDYLSEVICQILERAIGGVSQKSVIEAGSGSGRISLRLARSKADVTLLDYSLNALQASREAFNRNGLAVKAVMADIFKMPVKDSSYDIVWNAGVLEHYTYAEQSKILDNLIGLCKSDGMVITLNPYSKSIVYNTGKRLLVALNRWTFGKEYPISSIRGLLRKSRDNYSISEHSIGFLVSFVDAYKFLPARFHSLNIIRIVSKFFIRFGRHLYALDRTLSSIFGGYLIVSIIKNRR